MSQQNIDNLFNVAMQQSKSIDVFFDNVFGFFYRNSDFYSNNSHNEKMLRDMYGKYYIKYQEESKKREIEKFEKEQMKNQKEQEKKKEQENQQQNKQQNIQQNIQQQNLQQQNIIQYNPINGFIFIPLNDQAIKAQTIEEKVDENGTKVVGNPDFILPGNGGMNQRYFWSQTLQELNIYIPIENNVKTKDLDIFISSVKLQVRLKNQEYLINDEFFEQIHSENESFWTIEDGEIPYSSKWSYPLSCRYINISIQKWSNQNKWWNQVTKKGPEIDTHKINPESSNISDLDPETQKTVNKMKFDMMAKQAGKPTSDEQQKQEMLNKFMKQHPEMDFSKCKFN